MNGGIGKHVAPIRRGAGEAEFGSLQFGVRGIHVAERHPVNMWNVAEYRLHRTKGHGMAFAHESGANEANANAVHHGRFLPLSLAISCSRSTSSLPPAIRLRSWSRLISFFK